MVTLSSALMFGNSVAEPSSGKIEIKVDDTFTNLTFCKVELAVSNFVLNADQATGNYEIKVPAAPWKNQRGVIYFDIHIPVDDLTKYGGIIEGVCIPDSDDKKSHAVICHIEPQQCDPVAGGVSLKVKTDKRELTFDSNYVLISQANG